MNMNSIHIETCVSGSISTGSDAATILFAWGVQSENTWVITKGKICPAKDGRLLFSLICKPSKRGINLKTTYPTIGDIVRCTDGGIWEIMEVNNV